MMTYLLVVLAILTANIVSTVFAMIAFSSGKFRKWWTKQCFKMFDDMEEIEELL